MPFTANKGYSVQTATSNSGVWGAGNPGNDLNTGVMGIIDLNMAGVVSKSLSSSDVTLTAEESQNLVVRLTGTLLANVAITTPGLGFYIIDNQTSGDFTVEIEYTGGAGASIFAEQTVATLVVIDATNGVRTVNAFPDLMAINALTGTGIPRRTGTNTWSLDAGVADLADTTANRLFGTDGSGNSGLVTVDASLAVAAAQLSVVAATQSQMESQDSSAPTFPNVQKYHPAHPKAGGNLNGEGTPAFRSGDYGMGAVTDNGTGLFTCAFDTAFADTNYWLTGWARLDDNSTICAAILSAIEDGTKAAGSIALKTATICGGSGGADDDSPEVGMMFWGDYA